MARVFGACRVLMAAKAASSPNAASSAKEGTGKLKNSNILKPLPVSQVLKEFVGASEISRNEVVKKIWVHIKANQLQNPANKKEILCDKKLKTIFEGRDKIGMLEVPKLVAPHFLKPN
ncbi:upstream activation factor subunit UAF30-like [Curcuma longa]|uniref:upstream activation factor subunit UAF30-like n=1 Tax=Curcuma longa TaxID=136217 RepID=UPI003D9E28B3